MMTSVQELKGKRDERLIPLHFRFVPKDVWIRMHVDTRSTLGALKDAALDRIGMPPIDPTILPHFYEEARLASAKQVGSPSEARAFPKSFIARAPKRTLAEVADADVRDREVDSSKYSPAKYSTRAKGKDKIEMAKSILGGDPGKGGLGDMGYVGSDPISSPMQQQRSQDSGLSTTGQKPDNVWLMSSPSPSGRLIGSVRAARGPMSRASMGSLSAAVREANLLSPDLTEAAGGLDAYTDYSYSGLFGNAEAKRKEGEARRMMSQVEGSPSHYSFATPDKMKNKARALPLDSPRTSSRPLGLSTSSRAGTLDLDIDDSASDADSLNSGTNRRERAARLPLSSGSEGSSMTSHLREMSSNLDMHQGRDRKISENPSDGSASFGVSRVATERGRSGTIIQSRDTGYGTSFPVYHMPSSATLSSTSQSMDHSSSPLKMERSTSSPGSSHLTLEEDSAAFSRSTTTEDVFLTQQRKGNRIAGIHMDEISSWKDAQHSMSQFFSVYSFANGHLLDDWRTVAALRIRPYELLEIHQASPEDRIRFPRGDVQNPGMGRRSSTMSLLDEGNGRDTYLDQASEGWCYVFKPNSGNSKAQRCGLGEWKLRYIIVTASHFYILRKKATRAAVPIAQGWDVGALQCVFTERGDGWTRPALVPLQGLCSDILTLSLPSWAAPATFRNTNDSATWVQSLNISVSLRFVSQADHRAFFNTFARSCLWRSKPRDVVDQWRRKVVTRATIAGRGGVALPGKASRRGGRNALSRARLRPAGVSREFDDADRWSSQSEEEGYDRVLPEGSFNYADVLSSSNRADDKDTTLPPDTSQFDASAPPSMGHFIESGEPKHDGQGEWNPVETTSSIAAKSPTSIVSQPSTFSKNNRRSRGFSLVRTARKVIAPLDTSRSRKTSNTSQGTPTNSLFGGKDKGSSETSRKRRTMERDAFEGYGAPVSPAHSRASMNVSSLRSPSQTTFTTETEVEMDQQAKLSSHSIGRHRSYTVAAPSSSPIGSKRLVGLPQPSNAQPLSSYQGFQWPFRNASSRAAAAAASGTKPTPSASNVVVEKRRIDTEGTSAAATAASGDGAGSRGDSGGGSSDINSRVRM